MNVNHASAGGGEHYSAGGNTADIPSIPSTADTCARGASTMAAVCGIKSRHSTPNDALYAVSVDILAGGCLMCGSSEGIILIPILALLLCDDGRYWRRLASPWPTNSRNKDNGTAMPAKSRHRARQAAGEAMKHQFSAAETDARQISKSAYVFRRARTGR